MRGGFCMICEGDGGLMFDTRIVLPKIIYLVFR